MLTALNPFVSQSFLWLFFMHIWPFILIKDLGRNKEVILCQHIVYWVGEEGGYASNHHKIIHLFGHINIGPRFKTSLTHAVLGKHTVVNQDRALFKEYGYLNRSPSSATHVWGTLDMTSTSLTFSHL